MTVLDVRRRSRAMVLAIAAVTAVAGVAACSAPGQQSPSTPTSSPGQTPTGTPVRTSAATAAPTQTPVENADIDALSALECDGEPSGVGGAPPLQVESGGDSAEAALAALLADDFTIPRTGYVEDAADPDEVLYVYRAGGKVKSAIVVMNKPSDAYLDPWLADELRACDWTEFGADADLGPRFSAWVQPDGRVLWAVEGPAHCDMQSATFLSIGKRQYVRDPEDVIGSDKLVKPYDGNASLPDDAIDTTYRKGSRQLWIAPDKSAVFSVGPNRTELWPRSKSGIGCA